jgi:hypothetical protein
VLERIKNEPALVAGFVQAVLGLLLAFGVHLDPAQVGAIMAVTAAGLAIVVRANVVPLRNTSHPANQRGVVDAVALIVVATFVCVVLLLFGVHFGR